ncbi:uncharacterized protein I303_105508 [Kwoniella dejecticola CBS 10117]|uniref:Uncharacterized protein n=1 Tax=Kwoniella dejecticola CBS 10117 TaxID=1296121 RepID=A0AAJ8KS75_9TREE
MACGSTSPSTAISGKKGHADDEALLHVQTALYDSLRLPDNNCTALRPSPARSQELIGQIWDLTKDGKETFRILPNPPHDNWH